MTGALPSAAQRRVLDATLVAIAEHGLVPSVQASRMTLAAAPEALQGAVAAGILGCGSVVLGSSEAAGRFLAEIARARSRRCQHSLRLRRRGRARIPRRRSGRFPDTVIRCTSGRDPRALRLFEVATEAGIAGRHVEIARAVETAAAGS